MVWEDFHLRNETQQGLSVEDEASWVIAEASTTQSTMSGPPACFASMSSSHAYFQGKEIHAVDC